MRFVDEYRDPGAIAALAAAVRAEATQRRAIMEVCGGQTHAILANGIDAMIEDAVELLHGPGCPVCVTPILGIDRAIALALRSDVVLCSFGDMLRVPGSDGDLFDARSRGADVRVVYSPLDAVRLAIAHPDRRVVFFGVGFETTVPAVAAALRFARARGASNFSLLGFHVRVPPAIEAILSSDDVRVEAFLAAGHVCTVMGTEEYEPIVARHRVPIVVTGFEPVDVLDGVLRAVRQLERGEARVEIQYRRAVRAEGNPAARALVDEVFTPGDRPWRGIGVLARGALVLREVWSDFDAEHVFPELSQLQSRDPDTCRAGDVLRGALRPPDCPRFGHDCTPERPLGAPMVSSEGACAAYWRHRAVSDRELPT